MTKAIEQSIEGGIGASLLLPEIPEQKGFLSLKPVWLVFWALTAMAGSPGQGEIIFGRLELPKHGGSIPLDRWLAPFALAITVAFMAWQLVVKYLLPSRWLPKSAGFFKLHTA